MTSKTDNSITLQNESNKESAFTNRFLLGQSSKEWFLDGQHIPALKKLGVSMAGLTHVFDEYLCARVAPNQSRLLISIEGEAFLSTPKQTVQIQANQLVFLPKGQDFVYQTYFIQEQKNHSSQKWVFLWLMFEPDFVSQSTQIRIEQIGQAVELQHIFELLHLGQLENKDVDFQRALGKRVFTLLERILSFDVKKEIEEIDQNKLQALFKKVEEQLHLNWNVMKLSELLHCSKASLHRHCMGQYQCSPMQKITQIRMQRASVLLKQTDWPVKHIALQVGYKDPLNFSHRFKQWFKLSPKHYREQIK